MWLLISAGQGPEECAFAARMTRDELVKAAAGLQESGADIRVRVLETETTSLGNVRSCVLELEGAAAEVFAESWAGTICWVWKSTFRPHHKRKNWFVAVSRLEVPLAADMRISAGEVRFETMRAGGNGGQKVNKTESAVRATHVPSGKTAVARGERSQLLNKKIAVARLAAALAEDSDGQAREHTKKQWKAHKGIARGGALRTFFYP